MKKGKKLVLKSKLPERSLPSCGENKHEEKYLVDVSDIDTIFKINLDDVSHMDYPNQKVIKLQVCTKCGDFIYTFKETNESNTANKRNDDY